MRRAQTIPSKARCAGRQDSQLRARPATAFLTADCSTAQTSRRDTQEPPTVRESPAKRHSILPCCSYRAFEQRLAERHIAHPRTARRLLDGERAANADTSPSPGPDRPGRARRDDRRLALIAFEVMNHWTRPLGPSGWSRPARVPQEGCCSVLRALRPAWSAVAGRPRDGDSRGDPDTGRAVERGAFASPAHDFRRTRTPQQADHPQGGGAAPSLLPHPDPRYASGVASRLAM